MAPQGNAQASSGTQFSPKPPHRWPLDSQTLTSGTDSGQPDQLRLQREIASRDATISRLERSLHSVQVRPLRKTQTTGATLPLDSRTTNPPPLGCATDQKCTHGGGDAAIAAARAAGARPPTSAAAWCELAVLPLPDIGRFFFSSFHRPALVSIFLFLFFSPSSFVPLQSNRATKRSRPTTTSSKRALRPNPKRTCGWPLSSRRPPTPTVRPACAAEPLCVPPLLCALSQCSSLCFSLASFPMVQLCLGGS